MFAAALATLVLAAPALASPTATTPTAHTLFRRAGATGCTCYGQTVTGSSTALFYPSSVNNVGWCFASGSLRDEWVGHVNNALASGVADEWLNTPVAIQQCSDNDITDLGECATFLIDNFTNAILASSHESTTYLAQCGHLENDMVEDSFLQTNCQCAWECINGYERCGDDGCMDPGQQQCVSGFISESVQITRKRGTWCPAGHEACRSPIGLGYDCLKTDSDIEACGGCPGSPESQDCTDIDGVAGVSCRAGKCVVEGCARGFRLVENKCEKMTARRRWH